MKIKAITTLLAAIVLSLHPIYSFAKPCSDSTDSVGCYICKGLVYAACLVGIKGKFGDPDINDPTNEVTTDVCYEVGFHEHCF